MTIVASLIHLSTLLKSAGETLDIPELLLIGDNMLSLATEPEARILAHMASETLMYKNASNMPQPMRTNYDYGELWPKVMDDYRSGKIKTIVDFVKKKRKSRRGRSKKSSYVAPIDSYCNSKSNIAYWQQLLDSSPSDAVVDFLNYAKQVSCGVGDLP